MFDFDLLLFLLFTDAALEYFSGLGLRCPINYNPADFYIQELAVVPGKETECKKKLNVKYYFCIK